MPLPYDFRAIEHRWLTQWEADRLYEVDFDAVDPADVFYNLVEFPYPSAEGLHVGHVYKYGGADVFGRYQRMHGKAVFQPMGFDASGINAENYALKIGEHPASVIARTTARFRKQLRWVGAWDWARSLTTSDPHYYRWTQWIFLRLLERGLAYQAEAPVTWCPGCATVLAHEQVDEGRCERCDAEVIERVLNQWFFRTTAYADRLRDGIDALDWPQRSVRGQRNWIAGLRDWLISRQRYWGSPIPVVHCPRCGVVPVPDDQLPVELPDLPVDAIRPTGTGVSPLAACEEWVSTTCPTCGAPARRETDVMDTFVESSWYFLRYPSVEFDDRPWDPERTHCVLPVDFYAGGIEHVARHHLYARFVTMVLHDMGHLTFDEPFPRIRLGGLIVQDGAKMSKSRGNVVEPDPFIEEHGADVLRMALLFAAPWEKGGDFRLDSVPGVERFLSRVWRRVDEGRTEGSVDAGVTIQKVSKAIESLRFNVAIAGLMETVHTLDSRTQILLLAPLAPFIAEELWHRLGEPYSVHTSTWPARWVEGRASASRTPGRR
jgi:leucyl-tRNA synthetase